MSLYVYNIVYLCIFHYKHPYTMMNSPLCSHDPPEQRFNAEHHGVRQIFHRRIQIHLGRLRGTSIEITIEHIV